MIAKLRPDDGAAEDIFGCAERDRRCPPGEPIRHLFEWPSPSARSLAIVCVALMALCSAGCTQRKSPVTPEPYFSSSADSQRFVYALREHELDYYYGAEALPSIVGPDVIFTTADPTTAEQPYSWNVLHPGLSDIEVAVSGVASSSVTIGKDSNKTRVEVKPRDVAHLDTIWIVASDAKAILATKEIAIQEAEAFPSIVGPDVLLKTAEQSYSWDVLHPGRSDIEVTVPGVISDRIKINKIKVVNEGDPKKTQVVVEPRDVAHLDTFRIVVFDAKEIVTTKDIEIRSSRGSISAKFQIEDYLTAQKHFGEIFAKTFYCIKVFVQNNYDAPVTVQAGSIELGVNYVARATRDGVPVEIVENLNQLKQSAQEEDNEMIIDFDGDTYFVWVADRRPMNFGAVLNAFEFDQRHDPRNVFINLLRSAGIIASAAGTFGVGADYDKIISFIQGPVTETLAELLLADLLAHLGYLNEHALHESMTIQARGMAEKYVFFPRGDIFGVFGLELPIRVMNIDEGNITLSGIVLANQENATVLEPETE
ncbi:MAG: hypothetical protein V3T53_04480 [Phycisphaerales bacterium]